MAKQVERKIGFFEMILTLMMGLFSLGVIVLVSIFAFFGLKAIFFG